MPWPAPRPALRHAPWHLSAAWAAVAVIPAVVLTVRRDEASSGALLLAVALLGVSVASVLDDPTLPASTASPIGVTRRRIERLAAAAALATTAGAILVLGIDPHLPSRASDHGQLGAVALAGAGLALAVASLRTPVAGDPVDAVAASGMGLGALIALIILARGVSWVPDPINPDDTAQLACIGAIGLTVGARLLVDPARRGPGLRTRRRRRSPGASVRHR